MDSYIFVRIVGKGSYGDVNLVKHKTDRKQVSHHSYPKLTLAWKVFFLLGHIDLRQANQIAFGCETYLRYR